MSTEQIQIQCGPPDRYGKRTVVVTFDNTPRTYKIDVDDAVSRKKFRQHVQSDFDLSEDCHEWLENEVLRVAEAEDCKAELCEPLFQILSEVEARAPSYLWEPRIPLGVLSLFDGDGGVGKTQAAVDVASRGSRGDCMPPHTAPDSTYDRFGTLFITSEDAASFVMKPRVLAAGGDPSRMIVMSNVIVAGMDKRQVELPYDIPVIEKLISENDIKLLAIDPYSQFLASNLNINSDPDNRKCLGPLAEMTERLNIATLLIRHLNKREGASAQHRGGGSVAIPAACRSHMLIGTDPEDKDYRVLATIKSSLTLPPPSLRFHIEQVGDSSRVRWEGECDISAADICKSDNKGSASSKLSKAKEIIEDILSVGPRGSNEVQEACRLADISDSTYHRARREMGVISEKSGFNDGQWIMSLPSSNGEFH